MRTSHLLTSLTVLVLLGAACATETNAPDDTQEKPEEKTAATSEVVDGEIPDVDVAPQTATRGTQRLPIDSLEASIPVVAGNHITGYPITWMAGNDEALADGVYGSVLGRPDYNTVTEENSAPSSLYVKFMRDMARDVCTRIAKSDVQYANFSDTTLWRFAPVDGSASDAQINENLRYLVLRFLGMRLAAGDPYISKLQAIFDAEDDSVIPEWAGVHADVEGWRSVCIGLLESPAFHID